MDWDQIKSRWHSHRHEITKRWQQITERDVDEIAGDREHLSRRIQQLYGVSADEAQRQIDAWQTQQLDRDDRDFHRLTHAVRERASSPQPRSGTQVSVSQSEPEPGVSEDDAVPESGGDPAQSAGLGYMDDEEQRDIDESARPAADLERPIRRG